MRTRTTYQGVASALISYGVPKATLIILSLFFSYQIANAALVGVSGSGASGGLASGLVGYWTFDGKDIVNGVMQDKSGNGNSGQFVNISTSTFYAQGKVGQAGKFDGANTYVSVSPSVTLNNLTVMSASFWVNPKSFTPCIGGNVAIVEKQSGVHGWMLYCYGSGGLGLRVYETVGNDLVVQTSSTLTLNKWTHVTMTWDGSSDYTHVKFYFDGVLQSTTGQDFSGSRIDDSTRNFHIGYDNYDGGIWNGLIDDVRIYNRALTVQEVKQLYSFSSGAKSAISPTIKPQASVGLSSGLAAYWTLDGKDTIWTSSTAGTVLDKSGNGITGTLTGMNLATAPVSGKVGQGMKFNGTSSYIDTGNYFSDIVVSTTKTISAWIKPSSTSTGWPICIIRTYGDVCGFAIIPEGTWKGFYWTNTVDYLDSGITVVPGQWTHVTLVQSGTTVTLYVNGRSVQSANNAGVPEFSSESLWIGARHQDSGSPAELFNGSIDDVRIYSRALSPQEVSSLYSVGAGAKMAVSPAPPVSGGLTSGLVGYWTFDGKDIVNGVMQDKSGNGNNGNFKNIATSTFYAQGKIGQALKFDGVDDYVDAGNMSAIDGATKATWSFWIKQPILYNDNFIITKYDGNYLGESWYIATPSSAFGVGNDDIIMMFGSDYVYTDTNIFTANVWSHVTFVYDGSQSTNETKLKLYVNGIAKNLNSGGTIPTSLAAAVRTVKIGAESYNASTRNYFNGFMDDVRIYNRALSVGEIKQLYNMGR